MPRVKRGVIAKLRHKKLIKFCKGYHGRRNNVFRVSKEAVLKSLQYSYFDRLKKRKRFKSKFIIYINFYLKIYNLNYNLFLYKIKKSRLYLNRFILYNIIFFDKILFFLILKKIKIFNLYDN